MGTLKEETKLTCLGSLDLRRYQEGVECQGWCGDCGDSKVMDFFRVSSQLYGRVRCISTPSQSSTVTCSGISDHETVEIRHAELRRMPKVPEAQQQQPIHAAQLIPQIQSSSWCSRYHTSRRKRRCVSKREIEPAQPLTRGTHRPRRIPALTNRRLWHARTRQFRQIIHVRLDEWECPEE